jgi:hypothetical protein
MKTETKITINALGKGVRLIYLENNPHGYVSVKKIHKSKKQYSRKNNKTYEV